MKVSATERRRYTILLFKLLMLSRCWMHKLHMQAFGTKLWPPTLLCALLKLNYPLEAVILTNIICFYNCAVYFQNVLELNLLVHLFDLKKKSLLFYLKYIVLNGIFYNPTPSLKEPIFGMCHLNKTM